MSDTRKRIAVVGVGNILMGDEGIGVRVMKEVKTKTSAGGVDFFDAGTALHALLPHLEGYDRMIIVDSVCGGEEPGTAYRFKYEDLQRRKYQESDGQRLSLHDIGVEETLSMAGLTQRLPKEIIFIGVEPKKIEVSEDLSPAVQKRMEEYVRLVEQDISLREKEDGA